MRSLETAVVLSRQFFLHKTRKSVLQVLLVMLGVRLVVLAMRSLEITVVGPCLCQLQLFLHKTRVLPLQVLLVMLGFLAVPLFIISLSCSSSFSHHAHHHCHYRFHHDDPSDPTDPSVPQGGPSDPSDPSDPSVRHPRPDHKMSHTRTLAKRRRTSSCPTQIVVRKVFSAIYLAHFLLYKIACENDFAKLPCTKWYVREFCVEIIRAISFARNLSVSSLSTFSCPFSPAHFSRGNFFVQILCGGACAS